MNSKKAITLAAIFAGTCSVAALTTYATTKYLVKLALDRNQPKIPKRSKKKIGNVHIDENFISERREAAEKLKAEPHETVNITAYDGTLLAGHWFEAENAKRTIIAMHGWRSTWDKDFGLISKFFADNNCNVLYAEQRGQNNSSGEYIGFGLTERFDCLDWIDFVTKRCGDKLPIYLCGVSLGASTVLMASGLELPANVRGVMADCGFTSPHAIWSHVVKKNLHLPYGHIMTSVVNDMCKKKLEFSSDEYSTLDAMKKTRVPVIFAHGTSDHFVPVSMTYENYMACVSEKRLFIVPGADHGMSYYADKKGYERAVLDFWRDFD